MEPASTLCRKLGVQTFLTSLLTIQPMSLSTRMEYKFSLPTRPDLSHFFVLGAGERV